MIVVETSPTTDPALNLAIEEHLLRTVLYKEALLFFYVNAASVIVGRNQNVFQEVNFPFIVEQRLPLVRRLSGGGTVYHGPGNLNYCLLTPDQTLLNNYAAFTRPVVKALQELGLAAELRQRSSLFVEGKKVSGNAQYATSGRLLSHGTLLVDADLSILRKSILPPTTRVESRAIPSIRSGVINLTDLTTVKVDVLTVSRLLRDSFLGSAAVKEYHLTASDWMQVHQLADTRYRRWSWNIGRSPACTIQCTLGGQAGPIELGMNIDGGCIASIHITDGAPTEWSLDLERCLQGVRYERDAIAEALDRCAALRLPRDLSQAELLDCLTWTVR